MPWRGLRIPSTWLLAPTTRPFAFGTARKWGNALLFTLGHICSDHQRPVALPYLSRLQSTGNPDCLRVRRQPDLLLLRLHAHTRPNHIRPCQHNHEHGVQQQRLTAPHLLRRWLLVVLAVRTHVLAAFGTARRAIACSRSAPRSKRRPCSPSPLHSL